MQTFHFLAHGFERMRLDHVPRLMRTVRHLRSSQVWWRTRYLVERRLPFAVIGSLDEPVRPSRPIPRPGRFPDVPLFHEIGATGSEAVDLLAQGRFRHLHQTVDVGYETPNWLLDGLSIGRLWNVTLHYHGWAYNLAVAAGQGDSRALPLLAHYLSDWLDRCRLRLLGPNNLIWNAFAVATRISWWVRMLRHLEERGLYLPSDLRPRLESSLARQAQFLSRHLEWDLRANHLLRDAAGLAWAGRYLSGRSADRWLRIATRIATSQAAEQVLPDGGHFERSPMYHIHVLEDFVSLGQLLTSTSAIERIHDVCRRMAHYTHWMRHPDGALPLFNDGGQHAVCDPAKIVALVTGQSPEHSSGRYRIGISGLSHFPDTGMVAWHGAPWTVFWDVGEVGPDYQPGHAHADTLTFECSFRGKRLIVDPGTYAYDHDDRRRYDRSTAAHNTLCVDQQDSSEVWHIFRVGSRAHPIGVDVIPRRNGLSAWAAHTGYDHLPGSPRHHRQLVVENDGPMRIIDQVDGTGTHHIQGGFLLTPEWTVEAIANGWLVTDGERTCRIEIAARQSITCSCEPAAWHPEYGLEIPTRRLVWQGQVDLPFQLTTTFHDSDPRSETEARERGSTGARE